MQIHRIARDTRGHIHMYIHSPVHKYAVRIIRRRRRRRRRRCRRYTYTYNARDPFPVARIDTIDRDEMSWKCIARGLIPNETSTQDEHIRAVFSLRKICFVFLFREALILHER